MASLSTYIQSVWYRLSQGRPEQEIGLYRAAIEQSLDSALQRLGQNVADSDPATRARLQKLFSLTLSGGEIAASASMVVNSIPRGALTLSGVTEPLQYVPNYQDLVAGRPIPDYHYFTVWKNVIAVRNYQGAVPVGTSLSVWCSYVPTISETPDELFDDLCDVAAVLVMESLSPALQAAAASTPPPAK